MKKKNGGRCRDVDGTCSQKKLSKIEEKGDLQEYARKVFPTGSVLSRVETKM